MTGTDWISDLIPQRIDQSLRSPDDSFVRYLRLWWTDQSPRGAAFTAEAIGQRPHDGRIERALAGRASVDGAAAAQLLMVLVHGPTGSDTPFGDCECPGHPDFSFPDDGASITLRLDEIEDFADEIGGAIPANTDMTAARVRGLRGPLIPATLLVRAGMAEAMRDTAGDVEAWFLAPIPAGAVLKIRRSGAVAGMYLLGRQSPAAVLRRNAFAHTHTDSQPEGSP